MLILNIAAGKFQPLPIRNGDLLIPSYTLNVDTSYYTPKSPDVTEYNISQWMLDTTKSEIDHLNVDIFEFMERTRILFDRVVIYRFLEHVSFTQVEYFIYLISTVLKKGGLVDVIVPNYEQLAELILSEANYQMSPEDFQAHNIKLTTELLNEPSCPHASIWTPRRMSRFWELEGRFNLLEQNPVFKFDGRDIYLRAIIERI
ncbi:MAG: hypothetical protein ACFFDK_19675 [Promethearchaeota archaeon]